MSNPQYWILVGSPENFAATREHAFRIQGFKTRHRKKAEAMRPGDRLVYYLTGVQGFAATATVVSEAFEDHTPIWRSKDPKKAAEDYPWRVQIEPDIVLPPGVVVPAEELAPHLHHVQKWPPVHWRQSLMQTDIILIRIPVSSDASSTRPARSVA